MPRVSRTRSARPPESSPPESSPPGQPGDAPRSSDFPGGPARPPTSFAARAAAGLLLALAALFALPTVALADTDPPVFQAGTSYCENAFCQIVFNEQLDAGSGRGPAVGDFTVTADGATVAVGSLLVSTSIVYLQELSPSIKRGQTVTVSYTDPTEGGDDDAAIQDLAGNDAASFSETVTNRSTEEPTPPVFEAGDSYCESGFCRIVFNEQLDAGSGRGPAVGDFTVTADGATVAVGSLLVSTSIVYLQELSPSIKRGQTVTVSYTDPTEDGDDDAAIQDLAGNDAASFTETVRSESIEEPTVPAAPTGLEASAVSNSRIDLSWTAPANTRAISGYKIEVSADAGTSWTTLVADTESYDTAYSHTGLAADTRQHYRVSAINAAGTGAVSNVDDATTGTAVGDVSPPTVVSLAVKSRPQSGNTYGWGETIVFTVTFDKKVRVTGQPQPKLAFDLGGNTREARYAGLTDTDVDSDPRPQPRPEAVKVHFSYTVQPGDRDSDGIGVGALASALRLGGGRIQNAGAGPVDLDAALAHGAVGPLSGHRVDGGTAQPPAGSGIAIVDADGNALANNRLTIGGDGRGRYGFKLKTRPTHTVWVTAIASDGDKDLRPRNATWPIAPDEWETPFYVDIEALPDADAETGERFFLNRTSSKDPAYHDLILPDVVVVEADDEASAPATAAAPLTATFEGMPGAHDGASAFAFELRFSEEVGLSYVTVRDALFAVTGGRVTGARRLARPSNRRWEVTVAPDSGAEVAISLAPGRACDEPGAVCTADGRALSNGVATVVRGPEAERVRPPETPPLTASFSGMPPEHDGESAFTFEFAFSADLAIGYVTVRDSVLGVTGGAVTQARRLVQGSNRRWKVTVEPDSFAAVRISLAPGAACDSSGAPCNANGAAAAVPGPAAVSVADAEVHEAADAVLAFRVTLDRARHAAVTVDYATADGTATAGADYTPANGTLSFAPGEKAKTVSVAVLDDAVGGCVKAQLFGEQPS